MKLDEPTRSPSEAAVTVDCTKPLELFLHREGPEEKLPDAGHDYRGGRRSLGCTPSLDRAGVRVPAQDHYYAEPPQGIPFTDSDLKALSRPLRRGGIAGLKPGLYSRISDQGLLSLGEQPQLRFLDLSHAKLTDSGLLGLAGLLNLEWLDLSGAKLTDRGLVRLWRLQRLRHLNLSNVPITSAGLRHLLMLPQLSSLVLDATKIDDDAGALLGGLPRLRHLSLRNCHLHVPGLAALAKSPRLSSLRYEAAGTDQWRDDPAVGDQSLVALSRISGLQRLDLYRFGPCADLGPLCDLPDLVHLSLEQSYSAVSEDRLGSLRRAPRLQSLSLRHVNIEERQGRLLGQMTGLRRLDVTYTAMDDKAFQHLGQLGRLENLDLIYTRVTDKSLATVAGLVGLTEARLGAPGITGAWLRPLAPLPRLTDLDLSDVLLEPEHLSCLRQMPRLRRLWMGALRDDMKRCERLRHMSNEGFSHLAGLTQLGELYIMDMGIEDAALRHLRDMHEMTDLGLIKTELHGPGLVHLAGMTRLRELCLDQSHITDRHLRPLSQLPSLKVLRLTNTPITDAGLRESIGKMTGLDLLDLSGTRITGDGMAHLSRLRQLTHLSLFDTEVRWGATRKLRGRPGHLWVLMEDEKTHSPLAIEVEVRRNQQATGVLN